ncbi:MAG: selenide, water dikinase SelD, partial [Candidatus Zixiibacteriota bacterium]
ETLKKLPKSEHPNLIVGFNKADDAGVFRINEHQALVQTVDFFPPIVDDPYYFGQIAAANALSDVYAMGGKPLTALNIVGFPGNLPSTILRGILLGGSEKIEEAGAVIVGGHSIKDNELKYGVSVTGIININQIITNAGAETGNNLYLTKPLGTGIITTGIKRDAISPELIKTVIDQMAALNKEASEIMIKYNAKAATDITGFGLLGHAYEMATASKVTIRIFSEKLPILSEVLRLAEEGMVPGGTFTNREYLKDKYLISDKLNKNIEHILFDPQTSGGLLIAVAQEYVDGFEKEMKSRNIFNRLIGQVEVSGNYSLIIE